MWISAREWKRHTEALERAEQRAAAAEWRFHEITNRLLTKNGSMGIPHVSEASASAPSQSPIPPQAKKVGGLTEDEFVEDLVDAGLTEGEARMKWKQATEVGLLPYQMEGELPS